MTEGKMSYEEACRAVDKYIKEIGTKWVYLMYNPSSQMYKIGISQNVRDRQRRLEGACGVRLKLIGAWECLEDPGFFNAKEVEKMLHEKYKACRSEVGEWFRLSHKDTIEIWRFIDEHSDIWGCMGEFFE